MTYTKFISLQLKRGDVIEVRCGKELRIFTCKDIPHVVLWLGSANTMVDAVDTDGKANGIYFRDVVSKL